MKLKLSFLLVLCLFFMGCSSTPESLSGARAVPQVGMDRLVVRTANLRMEVDDVERVSRKIDEDVRNIKGYVDKIFKTDDKNVSFYVRVPEAGLDGFVENVSTYGNVTFKSLSAQDVTDEVIDVEAKLKNLYVLRDQFRALLEKAVKVREVLDVERELSRVQSEIDSIEGRRLKLRNQVEYSEVQVTVQQKTIYGPLGYLGYGLCWIIEKLFVLK